MKKQLTFYFIRHGRTVWNEQGLMQGSGDSPLTEEGIQSAVKTGQALQNVDFIAAYSSCLQRTIDTANYIIGDRNIPLFQHRGLNEHYFGSWEGTNVELIRPLPEFQQMINDPANYKAESNGGETYEQRKRDCSGEAGAVYSDGQKGYHSSCYLWSIRWCNTNGVVYFGWPGRVGGDVPRR